MIKSEKLSLVSSFGRDSFFACQQGLKDVGSVCVATEPIGKPISDDLRSSLSYKARLQYVLMKNLYIDSVGSFLCKLLCL